MKINMKIFSGNKEKKPPEKTWLYRLAGRLPDKWSGEKDVIKRRYRGAYIGEIPEQLIVDSKLRTTRMYVLLAALLLCVILATVAETMDGGFPEPARDDYGGDIRTVDAEVEAAYGAEKLKRDVVLKVLPKSVEPTALSEQMESLKERLPALIKAENASLNEISSDLNLLTMDEKTGIDITWESDREHFVNEQGQINLIDGAEGEEAVLTAHLRKGEVRDEVSFRVIMGSPGADYDYGRSLENSITNLVDGISESAEGDAVSLPDSTQSGIRLNWKTPGSFGLPALIFVLLFIGFAVYRSRYSLVDKAVERWREGVRRDFPGFLNKLLLLLNAGLVITSAITRIADDYSAHRKEGEERYFYEELCGMRDRMRASNTTLTVEFADMAARSGQREVMRFSTILADNIDRGNALAEKLSQESRTLWSARKKIAEEKGRLAETKLTFPMVLQLLVIILITVTPAVMNMR